MSKLTYEILIKSVAWFVILDQIRKQATDAEDTQLVESVRQHGILQPLGARFDGKLVWGHRRLKAAIAAGLREVPTVVLHKDMTEGEYVTLQMLENVQRADLSPYDLWQGCVRLLETNPGWQLKDCAKALAMEPSNVTRMLSPSKAIPAAVEALRLGQIGLGTVYAITRGGSPEEQERLLKLALAGCGRDALEKETKKSRVVAAPAVRLSRVAISVAGGARVVVSGAELDLESLIANLQSALDGARRAAKENLDIRTFEKVAKDKAKAGA
jgi:ParB/RepB/Spo0J family partition protein